MGNFKRYCHYFLIGIAALLLVLSLLSLFYDASSLWWIKVLNFPRTQALIAAISVLFLAIFFTKRLSILNIFLFACLLASIGINASFILAYTPFVKKQVPSFDGETASPRDKVSILVANVYINNKNAAAFLDAVVAKDPDLVLVMEANKWWQEVLQPLRKRYRYAIEYPLENSYGIMLYSKHALQSKETMFLEHADVPSVHAKVQLLNGRQFYFHGMHPVPPIPSSKYPDNMNAQDSYGELNKLADIIAKQTMPVIVAGDFNDVAWSNTQRIFHKNSKLKDVRVGRGLYNSFNAHSAFMRWPLDHVFVTKEFRLVTLERLNKFGSDHFPIYVKLVLLP